MHLEKKKINCNFNDVVFFDDDLNPPCLTFLIIGAGIAGLTVASELLRRNVKPEDIRILEARNYVGGRVVTGDEKINGGRLDNGAAWIHGSVGNPLADMLNRSDPLRQSALLEISETNPWMHCEKTRLKYFGPFDDTCFSDAEEKRQTVAQKWIETAKELVAMGPNLTISDALKIYIDGRSNSMSTSDVEDILAYVAMIEVWCGGSVRNMSTAFLGTDGDMSGFSTALFGDYSGPHCLFANGAESLIDAFCTDQASCLRDLVSLETIVTKIVDFDHFTEVHTSQGEIIYAKKVCLTIPPKPLQRIEFSPPLSDRRKAALSTIDMGSYKKVQLEWPIEDVFWGTEMIQAHLDDADSDDSSALDSGSTTTESSNCELHSPFLLLRNQNCDAITHFIDPHEIHEENQKTLKGVELLGPYVLLDNYMSLRGMPILEAVCPAEHGWNLCGMPDDAIVGLVMSVIRQHFPGAPDPEGHFITRWEEDIFSGGAYSYHSLSTQAADCTEIAAPLGKNIFFAGEYTDPDFYGSLNAAHNSGMRVVEEMMI